MNFYPPLKLSEDRRFSDDFRRNELWLLEVKFGDDPLLRVTYPLPETR